jgi:aspartyl protease family protein
MSEPDGPWKSPRPPPRAPRRHTRLGLGLWLGLLAATGAAFLLLAWLAPAERGGMDWAEALRLFGVLAVVSSGLASVRRFNFSGTVRVVAGWLGIFLVAVTAYALRDDVARVALKVRTALIPGYAVAQSPRSLVIGRGEGETFNVVGQVNGAPVRFVVDTGSTEIVLSQADAQRAGLRPAEMTYSRPSQTANGVGYGAMTTVDSLAVGPIRMTDVPVSINKAPMSVSLLGMPFLKRLDSFEVRGDQLFLRGPG